MPSDALAEKILAGAAERTGVEVPAARFPLIVRSGTLRNGNRVRYLLNYSAQAQPVPSGLAAGTELLTDRRVGPAAPLQLPAWGVAIVEEASR